MPALAIALLLGAGSGLAGESQNPASASTPPAPATPAALLPQGPVADNRRCFVCHGNYDFNDETLALVHAQANIGCVRCHGDSPRHSADEDGLTPPERMYPLAHVRFNCLGCHDSVKLVASDQTKKNRADLIEKPDHQAALDGTVKDKKFCTDCHGDHRLGHRTRKWDKRTGKLLYRDSTPAMLSTPAAK